ncbi:hypothetical protein MKW92_021924 [Papaver armeniacum]|nr:hypothetical protein MKW92_021924 [Papaver armeniacum]
MNSTYFQPVKPNKCQSECPIRDEENPLPEILNCTKAEESSNFSSSSTYKRHVVPCITKVCIISFHAGGAKYFTGKR